MIDYFFGKPRTGKTYRAVKVIYDDYISDKAETPKFRNILTNIGGFKFKEVNQTLTDQGSMSIAYRLVWKDFYIHLKKMYEMAMDDKSDDELNKYADDHKINDCLIVLDEASLYFKKYDDAISWWLAYHGHFKIRIIVIAQSPKQINAEYLVHAEIYYEAQPQSKQLTNNKLRYIHYSESYFSKDSKFGSDIITSKKEIFDLYKSGEVDKPKKILYKFMFFMVLAILVMISLFKFLMYRLSPPSDITNDVEVSVRDSNDNDYVVSSDGNLITFRCDNKSCWLTGDKYKYKQISLSYLKFVLLSHDIELAFYETNCEVYKLVNLKRGQKKITLASMTDYSYFIPKSVKNTYFKDMFQLKVENKKRVSSIQSPFNTNKEEKNDEE